MKSKQQIKNQNTNKPTPANPPPTGAGEHATGQYRWPETSFPARKNQHRRPAFFLPKTLFFPQTQHRRPEKTRKKKKKKKKNPLFFLPNPLFFFLFIQEKKMACEKKEKTKENVKGSPRSVLLAFSQFYVKHNLRKNKIVVASTTGFFMH
jgi:hypothetical protein